MTVAITWPLATDPANLTLPNEDVYGNAWALAWVVHQAGADPRHLFDSNMFYPNRASLAFAESLLPQALEAAPVLVLGGAPLLAHNVVLLLSFPLSGLGAYLLARDLTRSGAGALLAGLGFTTCVYRFDHLVHLQSLSIQWLPFALLFLRRSMREDGSRNLGALAVFSLLQALSSGYYAVLLGVALAVALAWHARESWRRGTLASTIGALAVAGALAVVAYLPYRTVRADQEKITGRSMSRGFSDWRQWSAEWSSYLNPGIYTGSPHLLFLARRFAAPASLYPGAVILVLAAAGLVAGQPRREVTVVGLLGLAGVLLSLGPDIGVGPFTVPGPFRLLHKVPVASWLRTPSRMGILAVLGIDLLAAFGWARLMAARRGAAAFAGVVALLIVVEAFPAGLSDQFRQAEAVPWTADWLARAPRGPVLELPWNDETQRRGASYIYWSTRHWQPMVNGWGSFDPSGNLALGLVGRRFPAAPATRELRHSGVRYVVVHTADVKPAQRQRILAGELPPGVHLVAAQGEDRVYVIDN